MISPYGHDRGPPRRGKWIFFLSFFETDSFFGFSFATVLIRVVGCLEALFTDVCIQLLFWRVF